MRREFSEWVFLKSVLEQGAAIQQDYAAGRYKCYEEYAARMDTAARERADELEAAIQFDRWQPIASAPTDGTPVDLWVQPVGRSTGLRLADAVFQDGEWCIEDCGEFDPEIKLRRYRFQEWITHWRPIAGLGEAMN